ncbi:MAG: hypothetical protein H7245_04995 [Candidatus Saccharibacteria bacterium]|nr:hypothetical protein [Pseudorhodobacter sp.]
MVPALTVLAGSDLAGSDLAKSGARRGVRLYQINFEPRRIVAMVPSQYVRQAPYGSFLTALQAAGQRIALPHVEPVPQFLAEFGARLAVARDSAAVRQ